MEMTVVNANTGRPTGSSSSRRLRRDGRLPGVVYGLGHDSIAVDVGYNELRDALKTDAGLNTIFSLKIDGTDNPVILRDLQRDATSRLVIHTDYMRVDLDAKIVVSVPIQLVGTATAVVDAGAFVEQAMYEIDVSVRPVDIPGVLEVDISEMTPDAGFSVGDIILPEGVEAVTPPEIAVAAAVVTRASLMADADEAAAEEVEGEEGEASAEGDGDAEAASDSEDSE